MPAYPGSAGLGIAPRASAPHLNHVVVEVLGVSVDQVDLFGVHVVHRLFAELICHHLVVGLVDVALLPDGRRVQKALRGAEGARAGGESPVEAGRAGQGRAGPVRVAQEGGLGEAAPVPAGSGIQAAGRPSSGYLTAARGAHHTPAVPGAGPAPAARRPGPAALPPGGASGPWAERAMAWPRGHGGERPGLPTQHPPHTALTTLPSPYRLRRADLSTAPSPHCPHYTAPPILPFMQGHRSALSIPVLSLCCSP